MSNLQVDLYADGGVIKSNPSEFGGTWSFVLIRNDDVVLQKCGLYTPEKLGVEKVTNNHMELIAVLKGLDYALAECFEIGAVYSDSKITLGRLSKNWAMNNIPQWLIEKKEEIMMNFDVPNINWQHLAGHPTDAQLKSGIGKRGNPVSKWNVLCDEMCNQEANTFLKSLIPV